MIQFFQIKCHTQCDDTPDLKITSKEDKGSRPLIMLAARLDCKPQLIATIHDLLIWAATNKFFVQLTPLQSIELNPLIAANLSRR